MKAEMRRWTDGLPRLEALERNGMLRGSRSSLRCGCKKENEAQTEQTKKNHIPMRVLPVMVVAPGAAPEAISLGRLELTEPKPKRNRAKGLQVFSVNFLSNSI